MTQRRSNSTATELIQAIKNSGLPLGNSAMMRNAGIVAPDLIRQETQAQYDPAIQSAKNKYMESIRKIAEVDKSLGQVYGDQNSQLYIENPMARERALMGAESVGYKVAGGDMNTLKAVEEEANKAEQDALTLYNQLITDTARAERESKKGSKKKTAAEKAQEKLDMDIREARLGDPDAVDLFLTATQKFRDYWIRRVNTQNLSDVMQIPKDGFNYEQLKAAYDEWKGLTKATKPKPEESSTGDTELDNLLDKYK